MRWKNKIRLLRGGLAVFAVTATAGAGMMALHAQTPAKRPAASSAQRGRDVFLNGDVYREKQTTEGTISTLSGNVRIESEDTVLRTDAATYNQKSQIATSTGKVQVDDAQNTVIGDKGVAHYKTRTAEVNGNVRITVRPRPEDRNAPEGSLRRDFKDPAAITCDKVVYNWKNRVAVLTGNLTLRQKNRTVTAEKAVYEGQAEKVTLTGNVRGVTTEGDEVRGEKAVVVLREGEESLELIGMPKEGVRIKIKLDEEEEEGASPVPTPPASPTPLEPAPSGAAPAVPASPLPSRP